MRTTLGLLGLTLALTGCAGSPSAAPSLALARAPHHASATRWVDTHGIEVAVPARWPDNRQTCGTPETNTVLWLEDGVLQCLALRQRRGLSVVEFGGVLARPPGWYRRHTTPVTIDGAKAHRWSVGMVRGSHEVQLVFPRRGIAVTVMSPTPALLRRILVSVRVVRVNEDGCPTRPAPAYRLGTRPSASRRFVPERSGGVVGCSYHGRWLDQSGSLGRRAAARLARALDAAPYGFSRAPRGSFLSSICLPSWRASVIVARFEYAGRRPVSVTAHVEGCTGLGASNRRWAVRIAPRWVFRLVRDARYAGDFVDPRTAR